MVKFCGCVVLFDPKKRATSLFRTLDNTNSCAISFTIKSIFRKNLAAVKRIIIAQFCLL
jgi:hypothetical protein